MATDEKIIRSVDLSQEGADKLLDFIHEFHNNEGKNQAFLEVQLDDGTVIGKVELVGETFDDDETIYVLRLSGI